MLTRWLLMALLVLSSSAGADETVSVGTREGEMHPDFLLPRVDSGWMRLSDFRGKKVFLFHFASW